MSLSEWRVYPKQMKCFQPQQDSDNGAESTHQHFSSFRFHTYSFICRTREGERRAAAGKPFLSSDADRGAELGYAIYS